MEFEFATATRIIFGPGSCAQVAPAAAAMGRDVLVVLGAASERAAPLLEQLARLDLQITRYAVRGEPTIEVVADGVDIARAAKCKVVIGFGGGSVVDTAKAIAALLTNDGHPLDYLETIGRGQPIREPAAPMIAIPTTAGTGTEVTRNAVLRSPEHGVKASLRSALMLPRLAVVDPELTRDLPPAVTASTGLDALTQVIEPFVSARANPVTDAVCREGMQRTARSLYRAWSDGKDAAAREDMAVASLFGGLALANAKLGAVHGIAGPLGGMFPAPHGAVCAALLPHVVAINVQALKTRQPDSPALRRYDEVGRLLTGDAAANAVDAVSWLAELVERLEIPRLRQCGLTEADFPRLIANSRRASSMKGNPIELTEDELALILQRAC